MAKVKFEKDGKTRYENWRVAKRAGTTVLLTPTTPYHFRAGETVTVPFPIWVPKPRKKRRAEIKRRG